MKEPANQIIRHSRTSRWQPRRPFNRSEKAVLFVLAPLVIFSLFTALAVGVWTDDTTFWTDSRIIRTSWLYTAPFGALLGYWMGRTLLVWNRECWGMEVPNAVALILAGFSYLAVGAAIHIVPAPIYMNSASEPTVKSVSIERVEYTQPRRWGGVRNYCGPKKLLVRDARPVTINFDNFDRFLCGEMSLKAGDRLELHGREGPTGFIVDDYRHVGSAQ